MQENDLGWVWIARLAFAFFLFFFFARDCEIVATVHVLFNEQWPQTLTFQLFSANQCT